MPFTIRFLPDGAEYRASAPTELSWAAAASGILVEHPCGGAGNCGSCRVRVVEGRPEPRAADRRHLSAAELADGWRLGCQLVLVADATVEVPATSRSLAGKSFEGENGLDAPDPVVGWRAASLPPPSLADQQSDVERLGRALGLEPRALGGSPSALAALAGAARSQAALTVALLDQTLLTAVPRADTRGFGLAIDIGSTSLAAALVDVATGAVVVSASRLNPQVAFGADVVTRIQYAREHQDGTARLAEAVRSGLADLTRELLATAGCAPGQVVHAAVAGNPTMLHTWAGVDPSPLGESPYVGAWVSALHCRAADVALPILPHGPVYALPMIGSYVGADAVAAALAVGLDRAARPTLLIDLGTNTEMVLASGGRIIATSAAAGPAFEGATISHGMRAAPGAIDAVRVQPGGDLSVTTIGGAKAAGLCGSGLIDLAAELLVAGLISPSGLLAARGDPVAAAHDRLRDRLVTVDGQRAFVVARAGAAATRDVWLTASDVRQLQLVKGSILAGIGILCEEAGVEAAALGAILLAGAFGNYVRKSAVLAIGLVPPVPPDRVRFVGNAAGIGARLCLIDRRARARADRVARAAEYIELASRSDYQRRFLDALQFPPVLSAPNR